MNFAEALQPLVWDSEVHVGYNNHELENVLRVICHHYRLTPAPELINIPDSKLSKISINCVTYG